MFKLFMAVVATMSMNTTAFAASKANQICKDFNVEDINEDGNSWVKTYSRDISIKTNDQIRNLPLPVKQKLIIAAKQVVKEYGSEVYKKPSDIHNTLQAVQLIREVNEFVDEEHFYGYYENANGQRVVWISFYPGAQVGYLFADQSNTIIAEISDGWVSCVD